jgi:mRNA-degrading endonuclease toxin of MazEF toxin-antitoxin module
VPSPCYGRVVWADLQDSITGQRFEDHPAVIVTPTDEIQTGREVWVVGISTKHHLAAPEVQVELGWHPQGQCRSGLSKPSWAVCTWVQRISLDSVRRYGGVLRGREMIEIASRIASLPSEDHPPPAT